MKIVFVDAEFTGLHAATTLVSMGLVTFEGAPLYVSFNDYNRPQVTEWLQDNVLNLIDERMSVSTPEGFRRIADFLEGYAQGDPITLVSAGKAFDLILLFELWGARCPSGTAFHWHQWVPGYLCHRAHLDLDTLFVACGIDPDVDRDVYVGHAVSGTRHHALYDAQVVRECFLKLLREGLLPSGLRAKVLGDAVSAYAG